MNAVQHFIVIFLVVIVPAIIGGILIDIPDHYRKDLSLKENIKFQYRVGIKGETTTICREDMCFNIFHNWRHFIYVATFCLVFLLAWLTHLLCDMNVVAG